MWVEIAKFVMGVVCGSGKLSPYSDTLLPGRHVDRIPMRASISALVQTVPGAYPASYAVGIGQILGVKRTGRGVDH